MGYLTKNLKRITAAICFCCSAMAQAQTDGPFVASSNFTADLSGTEDTRPGCYGTADVATWNITFAPPAGYAVRILAIHGDLVSWIKSLPGDPATPAESTAGVLLGIQSTPHATTSGRCDWCSDVATRLKLLTPRPVVQGTTMVYIQDSVAQLAPKSRAQYDRPVNQLLEADNKLLVTVASWLNTTGKPIHIEPTFTVVYRWAQSAGGL
jgi:hypothetical protein